MQNGPIADTATQTLVDNTTYVIQAVTDMAKQVTPQVIQDGANALLEGAQETLTTENAQSVLSDLLKMGSDAAGAVCDAVSDNPLAAGLTVAAGAATLVGGMLYRHHVQKTKAAADAAKKTKNDQSTAENDGKLDAANGSSAPSEDDRSRPSSSSSSTDGAHRSSSTSPRPRRNSTGHNSD